MRPGLIQRLGAEFLGTFFLVYFGVGAAIAATGSGPVGVALGHAFALAVAIWTFGVISGAHVNPAVSVALAVRGRFPWGDVPGYVVAQLLGGFVGALLIWASWGDLGTVAGLGATHVNPDVPVVGGLIAEIIGTFLLVTAVHVLAVAGRVSAGVAGLGIGLALGAAILALGPVSGASLNPARTLGPELALTMSGDGADWSTIWVYLLGPLVGGVLAAFTFDYFAAQAPDTRAEA